MKDILVVYYSWTGNIKKLAQKIAEKRDADIYEIEDLVNRKGVFGFIKSGFHAVTKKCTPIAPVKVDVKQYKTVIVCSPVWGGKVSSPVRTFLSKYAKDIAEIEYVIMCKDPKNPYTEVFKELDEFTGKKHTNAKCFHEGHEEEI